MRGKVIPPFKMALSKCFDASEVRHERRRLARAMLLAIARNTSWGSENCQRAHRGVVGGECQSLCRRGAVALARSVDVHLASARRGPRGTVRVPSWRCSSLPS